MDVLKINPVAIDDYTRRFTAKVSEGFFTMFKNNATGNEILKITPVEQVNYFVLYSLFESWKTEIAKLESPYFDYQKPEVQDALHNLLNVLSMNINIQKNDLEPLLHKSVSGTLYLILAPQVFFKNFIQLFPEKVDVQRLKEAEKYFKINKLIYSDFITRIDSIYQKEYAKADLLKTVQASVDNNQADWALPDEYLRNFARVVPVTLQDLLLTDSKDKVLIEDLKQNNQEEKRQKLVTEDKTINERFSKEQLTLNDMLKPGNQSTVHDGIKNKIVDIKSALTVNQKFMFINELFKGESWEFDKAMNQLNSLPNYDAAINMLLDTYAIKYNWDTENEQVGELFELVGRKFFNN